MLASLLCSWISVGGEVWSLWSWVSVGGEVWSFDAYGFLCRLVLAVVKLLQEGPLSPDRSKVSLFLYPNSHHVLVSSPSCRFVVEYNYMWWRYFWQSCKRQQWILCVVSIQTENGVWWLPFHCRYLLQLAWSCSSRAVCCWAVQKSKSPFIKHLITGRWPSKNFHLLKFCCGGDSVSEYLSAGCIIQSSSWTAEGTLHIHFLEKPCLTVSPYLRSTQPNCLVDYCDWQCTGKRWEETGKCCMPWASGEPLTVDHHHLW